jgi:hypothetical protein
MESKKKFTKNLIRLIVLCLVLYASILYIGPFVAGIVSNLANSGNTIEVKKTVLSPTLQNPQLITNKDRINLSGISSANVSVELFLNDSSYGKLTTDNDGKFEFQDISILKGKNKVYLIAKNKEGVESQKSREYEIDYDDQKPSIKQLNISNGQEIKNLNKNILIQGEVSEESGIEINGKKVFKITGNKFEYLLGVEEGNVEIKIKVTDRAGNEYLENLKVTYKRD